MANYVEKVKVGSSETWPVRDSEAHQKIAALEISLTTTNAAVNNAQNTATSAQTTANNAMPKDGGTFTNVVKAVTTTSTEAIIRNIVVVAKGTNVSTLSVPAGTIIMVKK